MQQQVFQDRVDSAGRYHDAQAATGGSVMSTLAYWVVAVFAFSIPFENGVMVAGVGSLARLLGVVAVVLVVLAAFEGGRLRTRAPSVFLMLAAAYAFWSLLTFFWSVNPSITLTRGFSVVQLVTMAWMIHHVATTDRRRDGLAQGFVLGAYAVILLAVVAFLASREFRDVGGVNPNWFALGSALAVPLAWGLALRTRRRFLMWINALYPIFAVVAVVLSASRGGLFAVLFALTVIPLTTPRLSPLRRSFLLIVLAVFASGVIAFAPRAFPDLRQNLDRLATATEEAGGGTMTGRTTIWERGVEALMASPIVGHGAAGFSSVMEQTHGRRVGAHNGFLSIAVGSGLVGLALFVALIGTIIIGSVSTGVRALEYFVALGTLLVVLMPSNMEHTKTVWFILAWLATARPILLTNPATYRAGTMR